VKLEKSEIVIGDASGTYSTQKTKRAKKSKPKSEKSPVGLMNLILIFKSRQTAL